MLREHRTGCLLPTALLPARRNQSPDAVRSRNPSKSTLAHDVVAAAVSHKHHSTIRVDAGLNHFFHGSHSRLAVDLTLDKVLFSPWFSRAFFVEQNGKYKHSCTLNSENLDDTCYKCKPPEKIICFTPDDKPGLQSLGSDQKIVMDIESL